MALILLLAAPCAAQTDSALPPAADDRAPAGWAVTPTNPPVPDDALDQINALRQRMGGGVAEQLQGLFPDDQQGRQMLQQVFDERFRGLRSQRPAVGHDAVAEPTIDPPEHRTRQQALRRAARQLEAVAADLEEVQTHRLADDIRAQAGQLWQLARKGLPDMPGGGLEENPPRPLAP